MQCLEPVALCKGMVPQVFATGMVAAPAGLVLMASTARSAYVP